MNVPLTNGNEGHAGSQLSILAESIGMHVVFYDVERKMPMGNATELSNKELVNEIPSCYHHVNETVVAVSKSRFCIHSHTKWNQTCYRRT
jgi:hypothetical protein